MVTVTALASEKFKELIRFSETSGLRLELAGKEPGLLILEASAREDDRIITSHGIRFFLDNENQTHIKNKYPKGVLIYWSKGPAGHGFGIQNPNYNPGYGCGRINNN